MYEMIERREYEESNEFFFNTLKFLPSQLHTDFTELYRVVI